MSWNSLSLLFSVQYLDHHCSKCPLIFPFRLEYVQGFIVQEGCKDSVSAMPCFQESARKKWVEVSGAGGGGQGRGKCVCVCVLERERKALKISVIC